jgi:hypothetical protein
VKAYRNGELVLEQPMLCIPGGNRWDALELNAKDVADLHELHRLGKTEHMRDLLDSLLTHMVPAQ